MDPNSSLKDFIKRYDKIILESIDELSNNFFHNAYKRKYKTFDVNKSFKDFFEYIQGYANYKIKNIDNAEAATRKVLLESVDMYLEKNAISPNEIYYKEIPSFITSYIEGVKELMNIEENICNKMVENGVDQQSISDANTFIENFMDTINESFHDIMNKLLWDSGYNDKYRKPNKKIQPVFL